MSIKLVIAGSDASRELEREVARSPNVELRENIGTEEIHRLVREAQVNVLPTFQATGIKLKLLLCLFTDDTWCATVLWSKARALRNCVTYTTARRPCG